MRSLSLLLTVPVLLLVFCSPWAVAVADSSATAVAAAGSVAQGARPLQAFRSLDEETELLLKEMFNLGSDLQILDEELGNPSKHQVLVLVSLEATNLFQLEYIELKIDGQTVAAYQYTPTDNQAMMAGGSHRLYAANLPSGIHQLSAAMQGLVPRDPAYKKDLEFGFVTGVTRTVLELNVRSGSRGGFPDLNIKEWD